jgi:hypothetical protein
MEETWDSMETSWDEIDFLYNESWFVLSEAETIIGGGAGISRVSRVRKAKDVYKRLGDREKVKKLVRVVCKVKGYEFDETKEIKDVKITLKDIKETIVEVKKHIRINYEPRIKP